MAKTRNLYFKKQKHTKNLWMDFHFLDCCFRQVSWEINNMSALTHKRCIQCTLSTVLHPHNKQASSASIWCNKDIYHDTTKNTIYCRNDESAQKIFSSENAIITCSRLRLHRQRQRLVANRPLWHDRLPSQIVTTNSLEISYYIHC